MKGIALSSCFNYEWSNIQKLIISFRKVCPTEEMIMCFYNMPNNETIERLKSNNITPLIVSSQRPARVVVERFLAYADILNQSDADYAVCVDAGDVYFQLNPFVWLMKNLSGSSKVVVGSEQLLYRDEKWGNENLMQSYPNFYNIVKNFEIGNAGSLGGEKNALAKICKEIYDLSVNNNIFNPDQAALNVLMRVIHPDYFYFTQPDDGWSYQCGTAANDARGDDPTYAYNSKLIGNKPKILSDFVINSHNLPVCLVHQHHHNRSITNLIERNLQ